MVKNTVKTLFAAFTVAAATTHAALFKVEVPADLTKDDVLNPTAEVNARLDTLLQGKIAADPDAANVAAVVFTKDGELIYRPNTRPVFA